MFFSNEDVLMIKFLFWKSVLSCSISCHTSHALWCYSRQCYAAWWV